MLKPGRQLLAGGQQRFEAVHLRQLRISLCKLSKSACQLRSPARQLLRTGSGLIQTAGQLLRRLLAADRSRRKLLARFGQLLHAAA
ncbi:hypothetical protein D3C78_1017920 [compost metagenome]